MLVLGVDQRGIFLKNLVLPRARRMLQLVDGVWVKQVIFAVAPPLVFAAPPKFALAADARRKRGVMTQGDFARDGIEPNPADARGRIGKVFIDKGLV